MALTGTVLDIQQCTEEVNCAEEINCDNSDNEVDGGIEQMFIIQNTVDCDWVMETETVTVKRKDGVVRDNNVVRRIANSLRKRSIKCLNRMHVMEEDGSTKQSPTSVDDGPKTNGPSLRDDDADVDGIKEAEGGDVKENGELGEELADGIDEENTEGGEEGSVLSGEGKIDGEVAVDLTPKIEEPDEEVPKESRNEEEADQAEKLLYDVKDSDSLPPSPGDIVEEDSGGSLNEEKGSDRRKRECSDSDSDTPSVVKKMKITHAEYDERERTVNEYVESAAGASLEEIQQYTDKIQQEVDTLNAMARAKEHEWNNIIRLKKVKEEMFLRLQRKKQVMMIMMGSESREDWDLSDMRYGECSDDRGKSARNSTKGKSNRRSSEHPSSTGMSLLRNNQHPHSLMMVPIVSSSPGNVASNISSITSQSNSASPLRVPDMNNRERSSGRMHRPILPKPPTVNGNNNQNPVIGEGRQGPILDVRSIIADYRSRHPETVPRRGRRLKSSLSPTNNLPENLVSSTRVTGGGGILSMANLALGSGSQMRTGIVGSTSAEMNDLGLLLNAVGEAARQESSRPSSADSSRSGAQSHQNAETGRSNISFKDVLVQFAKMSQTEQRLDHLPPANQPSKPPPYPDVTLHPVLSPPSPPHQSPSSSLLHGILTKSNNMQQQQLQQRIENNRPATFSPTLARLLTAPERVPSNAHAHTHPHFRPQGQVLISDLLATSKQTRNEITITPVGAHQPLPKGKQEVVLLEEEQEDSADRLVIDESGDTEGGRDRGESDEVHGSGQDILAEDVPECQGCHQRTAQFVCAGCGNQWYCSRDCQVTAWDEHSDVCSG